MSLEDVDSLDGVLHTQWRLDLDGVNGIDHQLREELGIGANEFTRHGSLGTVDESVLAELLDRERQLIFDIPAGLLGSNLESLDNVGGVHFHFDELVGTLEQFGSQDDD